MSMDTVDDLHYAEDCLGAAAAALAELGHPGFLDDYCRPTCRAEGGHHHEDDPEQDDFCGCLCHNREPALTPDPVPLVEVLRDFWEDDDGMTTVINEVEWTYTDGIGFQPPEAGPVKALRFAELALLGFGYVMTPILLRDDATGALGVYLAVTSRGGGTQVFRLPLDRNT